MSLVEVMQDLQEYEAQAIFRLSSCIVLDVPKQVEEYNTEEPPGFQTRA